MALQGQISDSAAMVAVTCFDRECGVEYMVPRHIYQQARAQGSKRTLHCPNGHEWHYTESEADRLKRQNAGLETSLRGAQEERDRTQVQLTRALKTISYWKGIAHRRKK